jgi:hypothetical protein
MPFLRAVAVCALLFFPIATFAVDLTKIDRTIAKQPAYRGKPKYCLLVFGPEAKTRIWLVQDGDTLYVDRTSNGDLTGPAKKVVADNGDRANGTYHFEVGDIRDGALVHKALSVSVFKLADTGLAVADERVKALLAKDPNACSYGVSVDVDIPGWKGTGIGGRVHHHTSSADDVLEFADKPEHAPILHFGGPLQITLFGEHRLTIGRESDIVLGVGTLGLGRGSTTYLDYEDVIPTTAHPSIQITYPNKEPGGPAIQERCVLKKRC